MVNYVNNKITSSQDRSVYNMTRLHVKSIVTLRGNLLKWLQTFSTPYIIILLFNIFTLRSLS